MHTPTPTRGGGCASEGAGHGPDPRPRCEGAAWRYSAPLPAQPHPASEPPPRSDIEPGSPGARPAPAGSAPPAGGTGAPGTPRGLGPAALQVRSGEGWLVPLPGSGEPPRCCGGRRGRAARVPPSPPRRGRDKAPPAVRPRGAGLCLPGPGSGRSPAARASRPAPRPAPVAVPVRCPCPHGTCWPGAGRGAASLPAAWCCPRQSGRAGGGREGRRRDRPALPAP